jgi:hypothetical protein
MKDEIVLYQPNEQFQLEVQLKDETRIRRILGMCKNCTTQELLDFEKHNAQYAPIEVEQFDRAHDRFLCIDETVYHIGASLKDLGKKWFAFSRMEMSTTELLSKI